MLGGGCIRDDQINRRSKVAVTTSWHKLRDGEARGIVMPHDSTIHALRLSGLSLAAIGRVIGKPKSYVQKRLLRIAAREGGDN